MEFRLDGEVNASQEMTRGCGESQRKWTCKVRRWVNLKQEILGVPDTGRGLGPQEAWSLAGMKL